MQDTRAQGRGTKTLFGICAGAGLTLGLCAAFLLIGAALVSAGILPQRSMRALCILLLALCAIAGGRFAVKRGEGVPILLGLGSAGFVCLLLICCGFLFYEQASFGSTGALTLLPACLLGGLIASFGGAGHKSHTKAKVKSRTASKARKKH